MAQHTKGQTFHLRGVKTMVVLPAIGEVTGEKRDRMGKYCT